MPFKLLCPVLLSLLLGLVGVSSALAQPQGPQVWWPVQPRRLPFLHPLFSDDMVLQREIAAPVWGRSKPGDKVSIEVDGKPVGQVAVAGADGRTTRLVPNTGLAMTIDIGDPKDIHPRNKQEVGRRLSLVARNKVYGERDLVFSGPAFSEMQVELPKGDKIRLYFKHVHGGLTIKPGDEKLTGFIVAGADKNWVWADAVIEGDTIVVSSSEVPLPKYVRYGWAWNPKVNLFNKDGLPAITFRTDE